LISQEILNKIKNHNVHGHNMAIKI